MKIEVFAFFFYSDNVSQTSYDISEGFVLRNFQNDN